MRKPCPGVTRGPSFTEAATIPSLRAQVIKQVNKVVALLKISWECRWGSAEQRAILTQKGLEAILLAAEHTSVREAGAQASISPQRLQSAPHPAR